MSMSPSSTEPSMQLRCESREYKEQSHANGRRKEDLHSMIVSGDNVSIRTPDNDGRQHGRELESGKLPIPSEMISGSVPPIHRLRARIQPGCAGRRIP